MRTFVSAVLAAASVLSAIALVPAPAGDDPTKPIPWSCAPGAACEKAAELEAPASLPAAVAPASAR